MSDTLRSVAMWWDDLVVFRLWWPLLCRLGRHEPCEGDCRPLPHCWRCLRVLPSSTWGDGESVPFDGCTVQRCDCIRWEPEMSQEESSEH